MKKTAILSVIASEILDSRGNPTVEATVTLASGAKGTAKVPSGASTGTHEALELRDGDAKRYHGKGVLKAVKNVNVTIAKKIKGMDALRQNEIDGAMLSLDGTPGKSKLGANAILAVSLATAVAAANHKKQPLYRYLQELGGFAKAVKMPVPMMNVINGGQHAANGLDVQEYMIVPHAPKMADRVRQGAEVFQSLKKLLTAKKLATLVGDEGGFAPSLPDNRAAFSLIQEAVVAAGYKPGKDLSFATDIAASEFYKDGAYSFDGKKLSTDEMNAWIEKICAEFPVVSVEDGLSEDDWAGWEKLTARMGKKVRLVGDDLFVTNVERLQAGIERKAANAILVKVNQIGSLSETFAAIQLARKNKYSVIISHRSGETSDTFIADLAVAVSADYIKTGSLSRSERVEKYNRLMAIATELRK